MPALRITSLLLCALLTFQLPAQAAEQAPATEEDQSGYTQEEIVQKAETFFGDVTEGLAKAIEKVFAEQGRPNALIIGEEVSGAIGIGARYGHGELTPHGGEPRKIYWQGPSIGIDTGGNASKVMSLIYNLHDVEDIYQRYPGVDGSLYLIAGASLNYLRGGDITIAPIRTGVGARAGVSVGYVHFTREESWIPF